MKPWWLCSYVKGILCIKYRPDILNHYGDRSKRVILWQNNRKMDKIVSLRACTISLIQIWNPEKPQIHLTRSALQVLRPGGQSGCSRLHRHFAKIDSWAEGWSTFPYMVDFRVEGVQYRWQYRQSAWVPFGSWWVEVRTRWTSDVYRWARGLAQKFFFSLFSCLNVDFLCFC
jgi:hypothetical protein